MVQRDALDGLPAERLDPLPWYVVDGAAIEVEERIDGDLGALEDLLDDRVGHEADDACQEIPPDPVDADAGAATPGLDDELLRKGADVLEGREPGGRYIDAERSERVTRAPLVARDLHEGGARLCDPAAGRAQDVRAIGECRQVR